MPSVDRSGSAIIMPLGYNTQDLENAKFTVTNGTTAINTNLVSGASGYTEGTTVGTITGNAFVFRDTGGTLAAVGTANPLPVREQYQPGYEDNVDNVAAILQKPVRTSTYTPSDHTNFGAAAGTGVLIAGTPSNVYSAYVTSGTSAIRYFQLFNQGSVPVVGQTPVASYPLGSVPAGGLYELKLDSSHFAPSKYFSVGLAAAISSTSGTLGTASITAADYTWHIKYV